MVVVVIVKNQDRVGPFGLVVSTRRIMRSHRFGSQSSGLHRYWSSEL